MTFIQKIKHYYKQAYLMGHFPSIGEILFGKKQILVYYGFLGDGNVGDELCYESIKKLFIDCVVVPVKRHMPITVRFLFHTNLHKIIFCKKIKGIIIGGGTMIGNVPTYIHVFLTYNVPIYIHGSGAYKNIKKEFWNTVFSGNCFGGVRGTLSKEYIMSALNLETPVIGDAAFFLFDKSLQKQTDRKYILVNFGTHQYSSLSKNARQEIIRFLEKAIIRGNKVVYLPFHSIDFQIGLKVKTKLPQITLLNIPRSFNEVTNIFNEAIFAIGERLHFSIVSSMFRCPFLAVAYSDKHFDFLTSINANYAGFNFEDISVDNIEKYYVSAHKTFDWDMIEQKIGDYKNMQLFEKQKLYSL